MKPLHLGVLSMKELLAFARGWNSYRAEAPDYCESIEFLLLDECIADVLGHEGAAFDDFDEFLSHYEGEEFTRAVQALFVASLINDGLLMVGDSMEAGIADMADILLGA